MDINRATKTKTYYINYIRIRDKLIFVFKEYLNEIRI